MNFKTAIDLGSTRQVGVNTYKTKVEYYLDPKEFKEPQIPIEELYASGGIDAHARFSAEGRER